MLEVFALLVFAGVAQTVVTPSPAELFPLKVGLTWLYEKRSSITPGPLGYGLEVTARTEVNGEEAWEVGTTDSAKGSKSIYRANGKGVYLLAMGNPPDALNPPLPLLVAPVKPGTKWTWKGELPVSEGTMPCKLEGRIVGVDRMSVFGRQTECVKVETKSQLGSGKTAISVTRTSWFASSIGLVKEQTEYRDGRDKLTETVTLTRFSAGQSR